MLWYTLYRKWSLKTPIKRCAGLRGTNWDLNASHTPLMQKRHMTSKNGWETAEALGNYRVYSIATKNLNDLNKTCLQKVQRNHKLTHRNLLQLNEDKEDEDENTVVDQTVSINTIQFLQLLLKQILPIWDWACWYFSVVNYRVVMDNFQNMNWSAWKPSERTKPFCLPSTYLRLWCCL